MAENEKDSTSSGAQEMPPDVSRTILNEQKQILHWHMDMALADHNYELQAYMQNKQVDHLWHGISAAIEEGFSSFFGDAIEWRKFNGHKSVRVRKG